MSDDESHVRWVGTKPSHANRINIGASLCCSVDRVRRQEWNYSPEFDWSNKFPLIFMHSCEYWILSTFGFAFLGSTPPAFEVDHFEYTVRFTDTGLPSVVCILFSSLLNFTQASTNLLAIDKQKGFLSSFTTNLSLNSTAKQKYFKRDYPNRKRIGCWASSLPCLSPFQCMCVTA